MDAVAASAAAGHDNEITRRNGRLLATAGHHTHRAAEHERIAEVAGVEGDGTGDRGDPHPVAVVPHAPHHAGQESPRRDHTRRKRGGGRVERCYAEDVEIGDRLGRERCAEHIADHTPQSRRSATVGFDGRRVVVGLHLHAHVVVTVEADHTRVVTEHAHAPVAGPEGRADLLCGGEDCVLEQVCVPDCSRGAGVCYRARERLVAAVLAPGLGERLEFDLERVAAERVEVVADGVEFGHREGQAAIAGEPLKGRVVEVAERHGLLHKGPGATAGERVEL